MPWSAGTFSRANGATGWQDDQAANIGIEAGRHDTQDNDFRNGINETINKAGQNTPTANLPMGGFKHTGVANAAASAEYAAYGQVQAGVNVQSTALDWTATQYSNDTTAAKFVLQKSRGATTGSNVIVNNGDSIGSLEFRGNNGTTFTNAASIAAAVDGAPGATNDMPGRLVFSTSADASGTPTERMRITSGGLIGVATNSPNALFHINSSGGWSANNYGKGMYVASTGATTNPAIGISDANGTNNWAICNNNNAFVVAQMPAITDSVTAPTERMRIMADGTALWGTTNSLPIDSGVIGARITQGSLELNRDGNTPLYVGRLNSDGALVQFFRSASGVAGVLQGQISVATGTVTYGAFCGNHWSQLSSGVFANILPGTVLETIDELCEWPGETEDRLARVQVSTTVASKAVYGVFMNWDAEWTVTHDMHVASLGAYFVRVHSSQTVQKGDLLESNGDGTARVQASDAIKSSTIGKVTCSIPSETYPDGSYLIPAVLYCG